MNRTLRRAAARAKPCEYKRVPLPSILDEFTVFNGITSVMEKLARGEIEHANGNPVFLNECGEWCEVCPALSGWISCWERYDDAFHLNLIQDPLAKLQRAMCLSSSAKPSAN